MDNQNLYLKFLSFMNLKETDFESYVSENKIDKNDGMHIWFEFAVLPFAISAIRNKDDLIIVKTFEFIEDCLKSADRDITEVIEFSLLEGIVSEFKSNIEFIEQYCGKETIQSINSIKKYII